MDPLYRKQYGLPQETVGQSHNRYRVLAQGSANLAQGTLIGIPRYEVGGLQWAAPAGEVQPVTLNVSDPEQLNVSRWLASYDKLEVLAIGVSVEYGAGGAWRRMDVDYRPGAIQLPPCSSVKAGLYARAGYAGATLSIALAAGFALTEGWATEADAPTYTMVNMTSGDYGVPAQARAVSLLSEGSMVAGTGFVMAPQGQQISLTAAGAMYPPFSPVRVAGLQQFTYTLGATDTAGIVQFLLDP